MKLNFPDPSHSCVGRTQKPIGFSGCLNKTRASQTNGKQGSITETFFEQLPLCTETSQALGPRQTMYVTYRINELNMAASLLVSSDFTLYWHSLSSLYSSEISFLPHCSKLLSNILIHMPFSIHFQTLIDTFDYKETVFEVSKKCILKSLRLTLFIVHFLSLHCEDILFPIMQVRDSQTFFFFTP